MAATIGTETEASLSDPFLDPSSSPSSSIIMASRPLPPAPSKQKEQEIREAVRDTVHLRSEQRQKPARTQTSGPPQTGSRPPGRRSQSDDQAIVEKPRASGKSRSTKKPNPTDAIDRLDYTAPAMFHHDGPFDALAPHRNKQRSKGPMHVYGPEDAAPRAYGDSAYPTAPIYQVFSNDYAEPPKKKVDAIAEAWGIHEPEPFEEFFAGGGSARPDGDTPTSSIYNGRSSARRSKDTRADERPRVPVRRSVPPPQPIFVGEPLELDPSAAPVDSPKRSKSLMQRFRKMRDAPNVPVPSYDREPSSPTSPTEPVGTRPTHKSQGSFLGRFGGAPQQKPDAFVYIDPQNKDLPVPPQMAASASAPGETTRGMGDDEGAASSAPGGLGRKTSLIKKVGRVVRGAK